MTVFKYSLKIMWKLKVMIFLYVFIFAIIAMAMGQDHAQETTAFERTKAHVGIINASTAPEAAQLVAILTKLTHLETYPQANLSDLAIRQDLFYARYDAVVRIPEDMMSRLHDGGKAVEVYATNTQNNLAHIQDVQDTVATYLTLVHTKEAAPHQAAPHQAASTALVSADSVDAVMNINAPAAIIRPDANPDPNGDIWSQRYFAPLSYILITGVFLLLGLALADFNQSPVLKRSSMGKVSLLSYTMQLYASHVIVVTGLVLVMSILPILIRGRGVLTWQYPLFMLNALVLSIAIMCLVLLVCAFTSSVPVINGLAQSIGLGSSFISGVFIPQELLSSQVQAVAKFFPTAYYVQGIQAIGEGRVPWAQMGVQLLFAGLFAVLALYVGMVHRRRGAL